MCRNLAAEPLAVASARLVCHQWRRVITENFVLDWAPVQFQTAAHARAFRIRSICIRRAAFPLAASEAALSQLLRQLPNIARIHLSYDGCAFRRSHVFQRCREHQLVVMLLI